MAADWKRKDNQKTWLISNRIMLTNNHHYHVIWMGGYWFENLPIRNITNETTSPTTGLVRTCNQKLSWVSFMGRTTGQPQLTKGSFVELAQLNTGAINRWIMKWKFLKFLRSLVRTKYHRETGQRWRSYKLSVPWEKDCPYHLPATPLPSLTSTKNCNAIPLEITHLHRSLTSGISWPTADATPAILWLLWLLQEKDAQDSNRCWPVEC